MKKIEITKEVTPFVNKFKDIKSSEDMLLAADALSNLNRILDRLTTEKEKLTTPLNATLKEVRARYKPAETQLEDLIADIRTKMGAYQTMMVTKQKVEAAKIADKLNAGKIKVETAVKKIEALDRTDEVVIVDGGSVSFRTDKLLKIIDVTKIPRNFMIPNEKLILEALKKGLSVEGCEIEEKLTPINYI